MCIQVERMTPGNCTFPGASPPPQLLSANPFHILPWEEIFSRRQARATQVPRFIAGRNTFFDSIAKKVSVALFRNNFSLRTQSNTPKESTLLLTSRQDLRRALGKI